MKRQRSESPSPTVRRRLKRALLGLLLLAGLYLLALHLFLNTPLGPRALSPHPERFRVTWTSAWSLLPGRVHLHGLQAIGHTRNVAWTLTAERARGRIDLPALFGRTFRVSQLHAEGVRSEVLRGPGIGAPSRAGGGRRGRPWTLRFERVALDHVREIRFNHYVLSGEGKAEGAFHNTFGGDFELERSALRMSAARLSGDAGPIAGNLALQAAASLGPYVVRQHSGLAGFDFLTGSLQAGGQVQELPFLEKTKIPHARPGTLAVELRLDRGRLEPGSRIDLTGPAAGAEPPLALSAGVTASPAGPLLRLDVEAQGLSLGRRRAGPPVFRSRALAVASATSEVRLSRLFATARDLRSRTLPAMPLIGDARAEGVEIAAPGPRAFLRATLDRAAGRIDLAGLLAREVTLDGLQADGVSARLDVAPQAPPTAAGTAGASWSIRVGGARLTRIREIAVGKFQLSGDGRAETTFSYDRKGILAVERAAVSMTGGTFRASGEPAAQGLAVEIETRIGPSALGGLEFLRAVSGTGTLRGRIASLGFLRPYLEKAPWLALQGQGTLDADLRLEHGRLAPGSRLAVSATPVRATIFDSLATGNGALRVAVEPGKDGALTSLRVRFERFGLVDTQQKGRPAYLRGSGLRIAAVSPAPLDLTAAVPDFDATLELPDAEVPDLAVYNALIPEATGLSIISGSGRVRLLLQASTATRKASGSVTLTSGGGTIQFQNLELQGNLTLRAPLVSPDLAGRRFDLKGTRLELDGVTYHDIEAEAPAEDAPWWLRARLDSGSVVWGAPLSLRGEGRIDMKSTGPLLTLFAQRSRFLRWFDDALNVENVSARGVLRLGNGEVEIESLQAAGGPLEVRSRMIFSKARKRGDLYLRYGRFAAGVELRDGQRSLKLRRALEWFENGRKGWKGR